MLWSWYQSVRSSFLACLSFKRPVRGRKQTLIWSRQTRLRPRTVRPSWYSRAFPHCHCRSREPSDEQRRSHLVVEVSKPTKLFFSDVAIWFECCWVVISCINALIRCSFIFTATHCTIHEQHKHISSHVKKSLACHSSNCTRFRSSRVFRRSGVPEAPEHERQW